jgi:Cu/Ag efflux pump CusA
VGTTVFGGMIVSTILNLFLIPILYVIVRGLIPMPKTEMAEPESAQ